MDDQATERHYSPKEIAQMWGVSDSTVRKLFEDTPGVLRISMPRLTKPRKHKPHVRLSVPHSVLVRVHEAQTSGVARLERKSSRGSV